MNPRRAWFRGEEAALRFVVRPDAELADDARLHVDLSGQIQSDLPLHRTKKEEPANALLRVDTLRLKVGEYHLSCKVVSGNSVLGEVAFPFWIARPWNSDRMRVWLWPHSKFGIYTIHFDEYCREQLLWYADKGFNSFQPFGPLNEEKLRLYDYAAVQGWEMGIHLSGAFKGAHEEGWTTPPPLDPDPEAQYRGHRNDVLNNPFHPRVARAQNEVNRSLMRLIRELPVVKTAFFNSEFEDHFHQLEAPGAERFAEEGRPGTVPHQFILPGVIPDNDEGYARRVYLNKHGDGWVVANERAARMAHRHRPDMLVFTDPLRLAALYDRYRSMDMVSTWTYTNPDPKLTLYIETLVAAAKPARQGVMHTVTLLNYPGTIAPTEVGWTIMEPDRLIECLWINLSRRPDGLSLYLSSSCDPFDMPAPPGLKPFWEQDQHEPHQRLAATWEAMKAFSEQVVKPFGPMIRRLERAPRRVAVLSSESSRTYSDSPQLAAFYDNYQIYHFYTLLNMCHVAADVVFDETILESGLDDYDALVLPKCDTLLKSVYDNILAFQKRGGRVIADQYLHAPIPGVLRTEFDFTYRTGVTAKAIRDSADVKRGDDHLDVKTAASIQVKGVTAEEDQRTLEAYAARLEPVLQEAGVPRDVTCSSPTALLNLLEKGGARYLFIINDKRTYGERFGQYKAMLEKAVPQVVTVTLHHPPAGEFHLCDLIDRKRIDFRRSADGTCEFQIALPAPGGKMIAILPAALGAIEIDVPKTVPARGPAVPVHILLRDVRGGPMPGVTPLKVTVTDPAGEATDISDYYAAEDGCLRLNFSAAQNDRAGRWRIHVEELLTGSAQEAAFDLESAKDSRESGNRE